MRDALQAKCGNLERCTFERWTECVGFAPRNELGSEDGMWELAFRARMSRLKCCDDPSWIIVEEMVSWAAEHRARAFHKLHTLTRGALRQVLMTHRVSHRRGCSLFQHAVEIVAFGASSWGFPAAFFVALILPRSIRASLAVHMCGMGATDDQPGPVAMLTLMGLPFHYLA